jgi:hypothetical protein
MSQTRLLVECGEMSYCSRSSISSYLYLLSSIGLYFDGVFDLPMASFLLSRAKPAGSRSYYYLAPLDNLGKTDRLFRRCRYNRAEQSMRTLEASSPTTAASWMIGPIPSNRRPVPRGPHSARTRSATRLVLNIEAFTSLISPKFWSF